MDQTIRANLAGYRTIIVAPNYAEEFNKLYAHINRFNADDIFVPRKVSVYGDEEYISFVKSGRDPKHDHYSPYDGTMPARFFIPGP